MKIRMKSLTGSLTNTPVADACGDTIRDPIPPSDSRRDAAATDHTIGATPGASPPSREPIQDNASAPIALPWPIAIAVDDGDTAAAGTTGGRRC